MASKNLGAVIQRAISDGAFRRQLQSDPAAALRGFNLTPDEVAAIRSGDSGRLMSLGVDQRMSKAFSVGAAAMGSTRSATSDLGTGATSNALVGDQTAGTRDGIIGTPTAGDRDALTSGNLSGTRAIHDDAPADLRSAATAGGADGTRAVHDDAPADLRSAASAGDLSGTRAVNDVAPFGSTGTSAVEDPGSPEFRGATTIGDADATRAVHDSAPFEGNVNAAANAATGDPYSGEYVGVSPDFQARLGQATGDAASGPGDNAIAADDNYSVAARMAEAGTDDATRAIHDSAPFDSGIANAAAPTDDFISGDIQHDPGDTARTFIPSDSADVQREMLDAQGHGDALGNLGGGGNTSS